MFVRDAARGTSGRRSRISVESRVQLHRVPSTVGGEAKDTICDALGTSTGEAAAADLDTPARTSRSTCPSSGTRLSCTATCPENPSTAAVQGRGYSPWRSKPRRACARVVSDVRQGEGARAGASGAGGSHVWLRDTPHRGRHDGRRVAPGLIRVDAAGGFGKGGDGGRSVARLQRPAFAFERWRSARRCWRRFGEAAEIGAAARKKMGGAVIASNDVHAGPLAHRRAAMAAGVDGIIDFVRRRRRPVPQVDGFTAAAPRGTDYSGTSMNPSTSTTSVRRR